MAVAELTEESTKEDIGTYVEQIVEEVKEERAGEQSEKNEAPKSDAQITSEHADNEHKETHAEELSGSETAEVDTDKGEDTGDKEASWLDDDLKAEVAAYGIEESEIADFASREELDRALRLFDKSAMDAGRKALAESDSSEAEAGQTRNEKGQFEKAAEPQADPPEKREGRFEFKPDIYDEDLEADLKGYRDSNDARFEALEARFAESDAIAKERHFDQLVDSLDHADLFGKTDHETDKEKKFREDLFVEAETYLRGRQSLGRPAELSKALLNRIARSLFAEQLGKKELKQRTRKISRQSNGRQGGGATRPQDPREDPRDEFDRMYKEMERA